MVSKVSKAFLTIVLIVLIASCGVYSFTGASISSDIKTISIQTFYNNSPLGPANMSVVFTEKIKDYFQQNTSLTLTDNDGHLQFDGYIENYTITPVAANASGRTGGVDYAQQSRVTITVFATYTNTQDDTYDFEQRFSFFKDYDQDVAISTIEQDFVDEIFDQIVIDIFNASVANW